ncbi:unnamed protein product [Schistosoma margrebowiei]|uniref:Uncharacterized protein n=1 Tax=Schistosoma margrebowiei TaxID=48269 RepID=A0A183MUT9_9TREM|nr:unnamed protein product [Schistosoma margrebowiei]
MLNRMKDSVDTQLRDQHAEFRKDRSCTDQIATLRIIVEQPIQWNSSLYINFMDYEKALDSVDRKTLWRLLRHYGVPEKTVNIIRNSYDGLNCKIVHDRQLTDSFDVKTDARQGCLHSTTRYKCLPLVVCAKYFGSVGKTLLTTTYCGIEQTRFERRKKSGGSAGSG